MPKPSKPKSETRTPDYSTWVQMTMWTRAEAIALALGLDPDLEIIDEKGDGQVPEAKEDMRRVLQRAFIGGAFPNPVQIAPFEFLSWLKGNRIQAPKALIDAAARQSHEIRDWRAECERLKIQLHAALSNRAEAKDRSAPTPNDDTLYKIVLGVAYGRYGYDPNAKRNRATKQIKDEVERAGFSIDDQAILNALRTAAEALDFTPPETDR